MKKNLLDLVPGDSVLVHCPTKEDAEEVFKLLRNLGFKFASGVKLNDTRWNSYKRQMVYNIWYKEKESRGAVSYGLKEFYIKNDQIPMTTQEFLQTYSDYVSVEDIMKSIDQRILELERKNK